jgi:hypothetical protein
MSSFPAPLVRYLQELLWIHFPETQKGHPLAQNHTVERLQTPDLPRPSDLLGSWGPSDSIPEQLTGVVSS